MFEAVNLWEIGAEMALESGRPGLLALVPLFRGGASLEAIAAAARGIEKALPLEKLPEAEAILLWLAGRVYTVTELSRIVGRERMIESSLYQEAFAEGEVKGRLAAERELCLELLRDLHPSLVPAAAEAVAACTDADQLKRWILLIPKASLDDVARSLGLR